MSQETCLRLVAHAVVQGVAKARNLSVRATNERWRPHRFAQTVAHGVRPSARVDRLYGGMPSPQSQAPGGNMMSLMKKCALARILAGTAMALTAIPARAEDAPADGADSGSSELVVFGRGEAKIGTAHAASEGSVGGSDLLVRPLLRVAELLEAVPGMVAAQHSGSGKANQYFLRGFNLDHGTDFTTYIDGVQMNLRSHGHGQGYLDLNGLIPEIVAREDFRKGPYRADGGDFALAGAAYMTTIDGFDRPWISIEGGSYKSGRLAAGGTIENVRAAASPSLGKRSATMAHGTRPNACGIILALQSTGRLPAKALSRHRYMPITPPGDRPSRFPSG